MATWVVVQRIRFWALPRDCLGFLADRSRLSHMDHNDPTSHNPSFRVRLSKLSAPPPRLLVPLPLHHSLPHHESRLPLELPILQSPVLQFRSTPLPLFLGVFPLLTIQDCLCHRPRAHAWLRCVCSFPSLFGLFLLFVPCLLFPFPFFFLFPFFFFSLSFLLMFCSFASFRFASLVFFVFPLITLSLSFTGCCFGVWVAILPSIFLFFFLLSMLYHLPRNFLRSDFDFPSVHVFVCAFASLHLSLSIQLSLLSSCLLSCTCLFICVCPCLILYGRLFSSLVFHRAQIWWVHTVSLPPLLKTVGRVALVVVIFLRACPTSKLWFCLFVRSLELKVSWLSLLFALFPFRSFSFSVIFFVFSVTMPFLSCFFLSLFVFSWRLLLLPFWIFSEYHCFSCCFLFVCLCCWCCLFVDWLVSLLACFCMWRMGSYLSFLSSFLDCGSSEGSRAAERCITVLDLFWISLRGLKKLFFSHPPYLSALLPLLSSFPSSRAFAKFSLSCYLLNKKKHRLLSIIFLFLFSHSLDLYRSFSSPFLCAFCLCVLKMCVRFLQTDISEAAISLADQIYRKGSRQEWIMRMRMMMKGRRTTTQHCDSDEHQWFSFQNLSFLPRLWGCFCCYCCCCGSAFMCCCSSFLFVFLILQVVICMETVLMYSSATGLSCVFPFLLLHSLFPVGFPSVFVVIFHLSSWILSPVYPDFVSVVVCLFLFFFLLLFACNIMLAHVRFPFAVLVVFSYLPSQHSPFSLLILFVLCFSPLFLLVFTFL